MVTGSSKLRVKGGPGWRRFVPEDEMPLLLSKVHGANPLLPPCQEPCTNTPPVVNTAQDWFESLPEDTAKTIVNMRRAQAHSHKLQAASQGLVERPVLVGGPHPRTMEASFGVGRAPAMPRAPPPTVLEPPLRAPGPLQPGMSPLSHLMPESTAPPPPLAPTHPQSAPTYPIPAPPPYAPSHPIPSHPSTAQLPAPSSAQLPRISTQPTHSSSASTPTAVSPSMPPTAGTFLSEPGGSLIDGLVPPRPHTAGPSRTPAYPGSPGGVARPGSASQPTLAGSPTALRAPAPHLSLMRGPGSAPPGGAHFRSLPSSPRPPQGSVGHLSSRTKPLHPSLDTDPATFRGPTNTWSLANGPMPAGAPSTYQMPGLTRPVLPPSLPLRPFPSPPGAPWAPPTPAFPAPTFSQLPNFEPQHAQTMMGPPVMGPPGILPLGQQMEAPQQQALGLNPNPAPNPAQNPIDTQPSTQPSSTIPSAAPSGQLPENLDAASMMQPRYDAGVPQQPGYGSSMLAPQPSMASNVSGYSGHTNMSNMGMGAPHEAGFMPMMPDQQMAMPGQQVPQEGGFMGGQQNGNVMVDPQTGQVQAFIMPDDNGQMWMVAPDGTVMGPADWQQPGAEFKPRRLPWYLDMSPQRVSHGIQKNFTVEKMNRLGQRMVITPEKMQRFGQRMTITPEKMQRLQQAMTINPETMQRFSHAMTINPETMQRLSNTMTIDPERMRRMNMRMSEAGQALRRNMSPQQMGMHMNQFGQIVSPTNLMPHARMRRMSMQQQGMTPEQTQQMQQQGMTPEQMQQMQQQGFTPEQMQQMQRQGFTPEQMQQMQQQGMTPEQMQQMGFTPEQVQQWQQQQQQQQVMLDSQQSGMTRLHTPPDFADQVGDDLSRHSAPPADLDRGTPLTPQEQQQQHVQQARFRRHSMQPESLSSAPSIHPPTSQQQQQTVPEFSRRGVQQPDFGRSSMQPDAQFGRPSMQPDMQFGRPSMQPDAQFGRPSMQPDMGAQGMQPGFGWQGMQAPPQMQEAQMGWQGMQQPQQPWVQAGMAGPQMVPQTGPQMGPQMGVNGQPVQGLPNGGAAEGTVEPLQPMNEGGPGLSRAPGTSRERRAGMTFLSVPRQGDSEEEPLAQDAAKSRQTAPHASNPGQGSAVHAFADDMQAEDL